MTHADNEDYRGPANLSWLVGRQVDRIGMAMHEGKRAWRHEVKLLESLCDHYLSKDAEWVEQWRALESDPEVDAKKQYTDDHMLKRFSLACSALVRQGVLLRAVQYFEEDFERVKMEAPGDV